MSQSLLDNLYCPIDKYKLELSINQISSQDVLKREFYYCSQCKSKFISRGNIFDFRVLSDDEYAKINMENEILVRDSEAEDLYDKIVGKYRTELEWNYVKSFLENIDTNREILDLGCGTGRISEKLVNSGYNVVGVDFSQISLNKATRRTSNKKNSFNPILANVNKLPFADNSFELIISNQVLEHLFPESERELFIKEISRILKPEGSFLITCYNFNFEMKKALKGKQFGKSTRGVPFYCYSDSELTSLLRKYLSGIKLAGIESKIKGNIPARFGKPVGIWIDNFLSKFHFSKKNTHLLLATGKKLEN
jgi:ubiquinone/menaquinone biosynthesis C-methylase UbiE